MEARDAALALALGRAGIGAALLVAPARIATAWIGPRGAERPVQVLARAVGARDLALGLGAAAAARRREGLSAWLLAGMAADLGDLGGTVAGRASMPRNGLAGVVAVAGGSALLGAWLARAVG